MSTKRENAKFHLHAGRQRSHPVGENQGCLGKVPGTFGKNRWGWTDTGDTQITSGRKDGRGKAHIRVWVSRSEWSTSMMGKSWGWEQRRVGAEILGTRTWRPERRHCPVTIFEQENDNSFIDMYWTNIYYEPITGLGTEEKKASNVKNSLYHGIYTLVWTTPQMQP